MTDRDIPAPVHLKSIKQKNVERYDRAEPCAKERQISFNCLEDHDYDHSKCQLAFENFRYCKQFWNNIHAERAAKGIRPFLPPPEERDAIRREHIEKQRLAARKLREDAEKAQSSDSK